MITLVFVALILLILRRMKGDSSLYVLVLNYDTSLSLEEEVRRRLGDYKYRLRSKIVKDQVTELDRRAAPEGGKRQSYRSALLPSGGSQCDPCAVPGNV